MKWKLTKKFLGSIVGTVILTLLCFGLAIIFLFYRKSVSSDEILKVKAPNITREFGNKIQLINDNIYIDEDGIEELKKYNSWVQVLDENGREIYSNFKPTYAPNHYTPGELVSYHMYSGSIEGYTIFVGLLEKEERNLTYVMGYPHKQIEKYSFYFNPETIIGNILKLIIITVIVFVITSIIIGYLLSLKLTNPISNIMDSIKALSRGESSKESLNKGIYGDVYLSLENLSETLRINDIERKNIEKMREEWIANITHDIKTPLSSIKGYSEILLDSEYDISTEEKEKYTEVILSKANYIDNLVEDLKLTYRLKNDLKPFKKKEENLVNILRETIIDILNNPKYEDADIVFEPQEEDITTYANAAALQRAFTNLIYNALIHNPKKTKIWVIISKNEGITVEIKDNGKGIAEEELKNLFVRYYRGTNTGEEHKGSGLGMSISKQIIENHRGTIKILSTLGIGTSVKISLPRD